MSGLIRCEARACDRPALWFPVLGLKASRNGAIGLIQQIVAVAICERHKRLLGRDDLVAEKDWRAIWEAAEALGVRITGGRSSISFGWVAIGEDQDNVIAQRMRAARRQGLL